MSRKWKFRLALYGSAITAGAALAFADRGNEWAAVVLGALSGFILGAVAAIFLERASQL